MADFYLLAKPGPLTPADVALCARAEDALRERRDGALARAETLGARFGAVSFHAADFAAVACAEGREAAFWIGVPPRGAAESPGDRSEAAATRLSVPFIRDGLRHTGRLPGFDPPFLAGFAEGADRVVIASDPFGFQPCYFAVRDGALLACTKLTPFAKSGFVAPALCRAAVLDLLTFEHVLGDRTLLEGVHVLPPGAVLEFTRGAVTIRAYCAPLDRPAEHQLGLAERARRLRDLLVEAVRRAARGRAGVVLPLSGGLDSRALLGAVLEADLPVRTCTFGLPRCRDVEYARWLARSVGVPHQWVEADGSHLPRWFEEAVFQTGGMVNSLHAQILSLVDLLDDSHVVLDGLGGHALTGGHVRLGMLLGDAARPAADLFRQRATGFRSRQELRDVLTPVFLAGCEHDPAAAFCIAAGSKASGWDECQRFDFLERQRRFVQYGSHLLRPFASVWAPFYAVGVPELLLGAPRRQLFEQRAYLHMHRRWFPVLARVPDTRRGIPLSWPLALRIGKKVADAALRRVRLPGGRSLGPADTSPTDYAGWFRGRLRPFLEAKLGATADLLSGIVDPERIKVMAAEHAAGRADYAVRLGLVLTLGEFVRQIRATPAPQRAPRGGPEARPATASLNSIGSVD